MDRRPRDRTDPTQVRPEVSRRAHSPHREKAFGLDQKPERCAREHNEAEIERWKREEFPPQKNARRRGAHLVFPDESGFVLTPTVRRTLAPRGQTPVQYAWDRRDRISAVSAITVSPKRRRLRLYFNLLPQDANVRASDMVDFLRQLKRHLPGPVTVVWDRGNVHDRSRAVRDYLARHPEIVTEKFPGYAPELNPDEGIWDPVKYGRLPNFTPRDGMHLRRRLHVEFRLLGRRPRLLAAFIRKTKLRSAV